MAEEVQRERGSRGARIQLANLVVTRQQHSETIYVTHYRRLSRYYDLYRQVYLGRYHPFRNNVTIPMAFAVCQSAVAQKAAMLFGGGKVVTFLGGGPEDQAMARRQEALVNRQFEDSDSYVKGVQFLTQAELYGVGIYRWFWRSEEADTSFRVDLGGGEQAVNQRLARFNGPDWEPIDILDFFPAPGFARIDQMPWVVWRYWMDLEDVKMHAERGFFDKEGVDDLTFAPAIPDITAQIAWRRNLATGSLTQESTRFDKFARPIEIIEYWGRVPRNLARDGEVNRVLTVGNRAALLRDRANPYYDKRIPFGVHTPTPDPHYFHAPGKVEIISKLQYASNRLANHKLDVLDLYVDPPWLASKRTGLDPRNLRFRPGGIIWADREVGTDMIQQLRPDLEGVRTLYSEIEQQNQWMQKGSGIVDDTVQGISSAGSDRQTAREFVGRQEASSRRILMEVKTAEAQWIEPLARRFVDLNRQFMSFPQMVRMVGANAVLDPITLQPIDQPGVSEVTVNDLLPDYDIRAVGATRSIGMQARQQNMVLLLQAIQANPLAMASINWMAFFRMLFQTFEIQNVDELLQTDPIIRQAMAMAQQGGEVGMGGAPNGKKPPGEPSGNEPGLAGVLAGMMGKPGLGGSEQGV